MKVVGIWEVDFPPQNKGNKTEPESCFRRKTGRGLAKGGVSRSCAEQQSRRLWIGVPEVLKRRYQFSCGTAVLETPDPVAHFSKILKVLQCQDLWVRTNTLKFH